MGISQAAPAAKGAAAGGRAIKKKQQPISVSYWGGAGVLLADLKGQLAQETRGGGAFEEDGEAAVRTRGAGALPDSVSDGSNVVVVRVAASGPFTVDAVLRGAGAAEVAAAEEGDEDYEPGLEDVGKVGRWKGRCFVCGRRRGGGGNHSNTTACRSHV